MKYNSPILISCVVTSLLGIGTGFWKSSAFAQTIITPDGSTPTTSGIEVSPGNWEIIGGDSSTSGNILFHSLLDFSVGNNDTVIFRGDPGLQVAITRVTGNSPSNILGRLETDNNFDLFLINPNGIVFGPNAVVDVQGSFIASTAESIIFDNGEVFSTASTDIPLLTINLPVSLQFGNRAESIQVNGVQTIHSPLPRLAVDLENTLALIGGDLRISNGDISATHGRIALGSVGPQSRVDLVPDQTGWLIGYGDVQEFQDIRLSQAGMVSAIGGNMQIQARDLLIEGQALLDLSPTPVRASGNLVIETSNSVQLSDSGTTLFLENGGLAQDVGSIEIRTGSLLLDSGTSIRSTTLGNGRAGNINIYAQNIDLINSQIRSESLPNSTREAGDVNLFTQNLNLQAGSAVSAATASPAAGGSITVRPLQSNAVSSITLDSSSRITTDTLGSGFAGDIILDATIISLDNQSQVTAAEFTNSRGGNVLLENMGFLNLNNSSRLTTEAVDGQGGTIDVVGNGLISLDGDSRITSQATGTGSAGGVQVRTNDSVVLDNASRITVEAIDGQGGDIAIRAGRNIDLDNDSRITSETTGSGTAGNITLFADRNVNIRDFSGVTVSSIAGNAGNITINSNRVLMLDWSTISASSIGANGGNITFNNQASIELGDRTNIENRALSRGGNRILATVEGNSNVTGGVITFNNVGQIDMMCCDNTISAEARLNANGGNIFFNFPTQTGPFLGGGRIDSPGNLTVNNDVTAIAEAGSGGFIQVNNFSIINPWYEPGNPLRPALTDVPTNFVEFNRPGSEPLSEFTARSVSGRDGTVEVNPIRDNVEPTELPSDLLDEEIADGCSTGIAQLRERRSRQSTFTIVGQGGLAPGVETSLISNSSQVPLTPWVNPETSSDDRSEAFPAPNVSVDLSEQGLAAICISPSTPP